MYSSKKLTGLLKGCKITLTFTLLFTEKNKFYNFCWTFKSGNGDVLTPAQRIGITYKQFQYNDIIYFS